MDVLTAILSRRSTKRFRPDPVPRGAIERLLEAAVRAPNHWLTEPWHFYVVTGAGRDRVADLRARQMRESGETDADRISRHTVEIRTIPALIFVSVRAGRSEQETRENRLATAAAVMNMLLAAHGQGLGAIWRTGQFIHYEPLREYLGVPENAEIIAQVYVGYPAERRDTPRTPWQEKTTWVAE